MLQAKKTVSIDYFRIRDAALQLVWNGGLCGGISWRQRERHQTKGLMSRTMVMHVRDKALYISLPSSAKQQREMTKFCALHGTWTTTVDVLYFHLELHWPPLHI